MNFVIGCVGGLLALTCLSANAWGTGQVQETAASETGKPVASSAKEERPIPVIVSDEALKIHMAGMLFDGHNDLPWTIRDKGGSSFELTDIRKPQPQMHTDIPRLLKGGVKAQFWSVFVPVTARDENKALLMTLEQIDLVHKMCETYPDQFEIALGTDDIRRIVAEGKIASMMGVEGGHSIENSMQNLRRLYERGARYMTLTHGKNVEWADSATDEPVHNGLTPFGQEVVREMNRLGMLVDISHVTPDVMHQTLDISESPVIFSHSSARAINKHPRNVPDDVLKRLPDNGGVVMVNFYARFIAPDAAMEKDEKARGTIYDVVDHIEHVIKTAGIDHVGIGSDFDGVDALPLGLDDVSFYPAITQIMLDRGYSAEDIHKMLGGNILRAFAKCEEASARLEKAETADSSDGK
jgi:membrane dipeptidase